MIADALAQVRSVYLNDELSEANRIPKRKILEWMHSQSLEVRGCVYCLLADAERARYIDPELDFEDYYRFVIPYLEQCIVEDPDTEWTDTRYLAGHALAVWIVSFWKSEAVPREKLEEIKIRLACLYKNGDEGVRSAVTTAVLEHLFEEPSLAAFFEDWQVDQILAPAYRDALLWAQSKPSSAGL